jgi:c-di-AMP phosphodiesterase-like protein
MAATLFFIGLLIGAIAAFFYTTTNNLLLTLIITLLLIVLIFISLKKPREKVRFDEQYLHHL